MVNIDLNFISRIIIAFVVVKYCLPKTIIYKNQPYPVGLGRFISLTWLSNDYYYKPLRLLTLICCFLFVINFFSPFPIFIMALYTLLYGTLRNSQGAKSHLIQLTSLILIGLFITDLYAKYMGIDNDELLSLQILVSQGILVACYFTAGISKLIKSNWMWASLTVNAPLQMVKTARQRHHTRIESERKLNRKILLADFFYSRPHLCKAFFSLGLMIEISSPIFLQNQFSTLILGLLLVSFHYVNLQVMSVSFNENLYLIFGLLLVPNIYEPVNLLF